VDEAAGVGGGEAATDLQVHGDDLAPAPRGGGLPGAQGLALDVLHGEVDLAVVLADLVDLDDVGVGQAGEGLGLAAAAGADVGVVAAGEDEFDCDLAVELLVVGGVDDAHAAGADAAEDGEAADAGRLGGGAEQAGLDVGAGELVDEGRRSCWFVGRHRAEDYCSGPRARGATAPGRVWRPTRCGGAGR
jgi:hypothetical protein